MSNNPFIVNYEEYIEKFRDLGAFEKETALKNMTDVQRREFFRVFVMHPSVTITEICTLPQPFNHWAKMHLVGNKANDIPEQTRIFFIEPTSLGVNGKRKAVQLEEPSRQNRRQYKEISGPVALPAKKAIQAVECYGELGPEYNRNWLREIGEDEYLAKSAIGRQEKLAAALAKDEERKKREVEKARELLVAAGEMAPEIPKVNLEDIELKKALELIEAKGLTLTAKSKKLAEEELAAQEEAEQVDPTTDPVS